MRAEGKPRNVTMKDVAQRANVSLGTVSRIINGNDTVAAELREHVEGVIRELGFRPNVSARTMRTQRTHAIGLIVTDLRQPVAASLVAAASELARRQGFAPIVGDFHNDVLAEETLLRFMAERSVDGMLLTISSDENVDLLARLEAMRIPIVLWERDAGRLFPSVRTDHRFGAALAGEALRRRGRQNVLLVAGHEHTWTGREQVAGMRAGLGEGLRLSVVHTGRFDPAWLSTALTGEGRFDAVVANIHDIPQILLTVAHAGLHCPRDLSVIAIGDDPFLAICNPPVASVRLQPENVGRAAARLLLNLIDHKSGARPAETGLVIPDFVARGSI